MFGVILRLQSFVPFHGQRGLPRIFYSIFFIIWRPLSRRRYHNVEYLCKVAINSHPRLRVHAYVRTRVYVYVSGSIVRARSHRKRGKLYFYSQLHKPGIFIILMLSQWYITVIIVFTVLLYEAGCYRRSRKRGVQLQIYMQNPFGQKNADGL